jgi:hypothetical protein
MSASQWLRTEFRQTGLFLPELLAEDARMAKRALKRVPIKVDSKSRSRFLTWSHFLTENSPKSALTLGCF